MRREPKAVAGWILVWLLALVVLGVLEFATAGLAGPVMRRGGGVLGLVERFGPLWPLVVPTLLVLWIMTAATVFRAVMRPDEHGWALFRLGQDEGRLAVITAVGFALVVLFGSGPALVLWLLSKPVLFLAPALDRWTVAGGTAATLALEIWIAVRLSLVPVHTFAEGRFHVVGYWRLTERCFWRLSASYVLVFLQIAFFLLVLGVAAVALGRAAVAVASLPRADLAARIIAGALIFGVGFVSAMLFVVPSTLLGACQARAYQTIMETTPLAPRPRLHRDQPPPSAL
ncbi:MAG: hypothetical protein ACRED9_01375 [Caulobacteraceae bacterium]